MLYDLDPVDVGVDDVADVGEDVVVDLHPVLVDGWHPDFILMLHFVSVQAIEKLQCRLLIEQASGPKVTCLITDPV